MSVADVARSPEKSCIVNKFTPFSHMFAYFLVKTRFFPKTFLVIFSEGFLIIF